MHTQQHTIYEFVFHVAQVGASVLFLLYSS